MFTILYKMHAFTRIAKRALTYQMRLQMYLSRSYIQLHNPTSKHTSNEGISVALSKRSSSSVKTMDTNIEVDDLSHRAAFKLPTKRHLRDILSQRLNSSSNDFIFEANGNVKDALAHLTTKNISAGIVIDSKGEVAGMFTARDIIRFLHEKYSSTAKPAYEFILKTKIHEVFTPKEKVIFCSPDDSVRHCREIMFQHNIRHVPVIEDGHILGIVSIGELSDSTFSVENCGGKKSFMNNVVGRLGLPQGTRAKLTIPEKEYVFNSVNSDQRLHGITVSNFALPHPYKSSDRVGASRRDYGPGELCLDNALCEDAHACVNALGDTKSLSESKHMFLILADGVGSWRQYGIDPRKFAHKIVENAKRIIESDAVQRNVLQQNGIENGSLFQSEPMHPLDVMVDAWSATRAEEITGSCTLCVASIDNMTNQLLVSNIGDSGVLIVRNMNIKTIGCMRERQAPRQLHKSDLKIAFISQQQLRSFNLPYQLGFSGIPEHQGNFEKPSDANTFSVPVLPGDVIVLASDGLFDNLELDDILQEVRKWEEKWFGNSDLKEELVALEQKAMDALAHQLVHKAREFSLLKDKDSPFALLAKDNDIMWSGGMPDDTTVICARMFLPKT